MLGEEVTIPEVRLNMREEGLKSQFAYNVNTLTFPLLAAPETSSLSLLGFQPSNIRGAIPKEHWLSATATVTNSQSQSARTLSYSPSSKKCWSGLSRQSVGASLSCSPGVISFSTMLKLVRWYRVGSGGGGFLCHSLTCAAA